MATLEQMLDVETEIESVFKTYLSTLITTATIYRSDSNVELDTPRFDVTATLVEQGMHQVTIPTGTFVNRPVYDQFRCRAEINLVYDPSYDQSQATLRAKMRVGLTAYQAIQTQFNVNGYLILAPDTLRQIDGQREINDEQKEETITTVVEGMFFLNYTTLQALS